MKRASYREAVMLIAMNDGPGDTEALDAEHVRSLTTVVLIADLFGVEPEKLAKDVVRYRKKVVAAHRESLADTIAGITRRSNGRRADVVIQAWSATRKAVT